jgi:hypothetical protein
MKGYVCLVVLAASLFACSCGGGPGTNPEPQEPKITSVSVAPREATVIADSTFQFTATVLGTGNFDPTVNWFVNDIMSGNMAVGTIDISGLYTGPAKVPDPATVIVKAVSRENSAKYATASVTITAPPPTPEKIAFWRYGPAYDLQNCGGYCEDIWSANLDGTELRKLTTDPGQDLEPAFSPDGRSIAFTKSWPYSSISIYIMNSDGSSARRVETGTDFSVNPGWSPDGKKLTFIGWYGDYIGVSVIDLATLEVNMLTKEYCPKPGSCNIPGHPRLSPDGTKIAYGTQKDGKGEIYVIKFEDGSEQNITNTVEISESWPEWSPDGERLAFKSDATGQREVYIMAADGTGVTKLTDTFIPPELDPSTRGAVNPVWSPDGTTILFVKLIPGGGFYTIRADGTESEKQLNLPFDGNYPTWARVE